jgi:hypothetical protein
MTNFRGVLICNMHLQNKVNKVQYAVSSHKKWSLSGLLNPNYDTCPTNFFRCSGGGRLGLAGICLGAKGVGGSG